MTTPCKDCTRRSKANCPNYRICNKYAEWVTVVWAEIQAKFAELAAKGQ